jgi:hypothetical protein
MSHKCFHEQLLLILFADIVTSIDGNNGMGEMKIDVCSWCILKKEMAPRQSQEGYSS